MRQINAARHDALLSCQRRRTNRMPPLFSNGIIRPRRNSRLARALPLCRRADAVEREMLPLLRRAARSCQLGESHQRTSRRQRLRHLHYGFECIFALQRDSNPDLGKIRRDQNAPVVFLRISRLPWPNRNHEQICRLWEGRNYPDRRAARPIPEIWRPPLSRHFRSARTRDERLYLEHLPDHCRSRHLGPGGPPRTEGRNEQRPARQSLRLPGRQHLKPNIDQQDRRLFE